MKKGIETLKEILTANILILIVLFFSIPVSAEVLDKFGGCKSPYIFRVLTISVFLFLFFHFVRLKVLSKLVILISIFGIIWYTIIPLLAVMKFFPKWISSARHDFYYEVYQCPQYSKIGYWEQSFIAIIFYIFLLILLSRNNHQLS